MKLTCSCGATGEFRDNIAGAVDANKWNASHEVCRQAGTKREAEHRRIYEAEAAQITAPLRSEIEKLRALLRRYRNETPLGHQPHMIAHEVDAALAKDGPQ